jgi:peptidyl-prolyl cis-trans isomerase B (cyclophilin B)
MHSISFYRLTRRLLITLAICTLAIAALTLVTGCANTAAQNTEPSAASNTGSNTANTGNDSSDSANGTSSSRDSAATAEETPQVKITMEDGGTILLELDQKAAPQTVENFLKLVDAGFYNGLTFHRVIPGFMIQGGDPKGDGTGGSDQTIKGEFANNGVSNPISHQRGVISMARSQDPNSASSQFFITNADATGLDGDYAAFGHVLEGMDVVDRISTVETDARDKPLTPVIIKSIETVP